MEIERNKSVTLTVTEACNLNCSYCYENHKSKKRMNLETAKRILDYELNLDDGFKGVTIDFFGGEPFLEFDLIRSVSEYLWSNDYKKPYTIFVSSNGTLVHGEIQSWLAKHKDRFSVGLSFDGNEYMQNVNRSNSFDTIDLDFFAKTWPDQGVKMTISLETLPYLYEGVKFLQEKGFIVNCNLAYGLDWSDESLREILEEQLMKLIEHYVDDIKLRPCSMLNMEIGAVAYALEYAKWCGAGTQMRVYSPEGRLYPCHYFQPLSVGDELSEKSLKIDFSKAEELMDPECKNCSVLSVCPTCYGSNFASTGDVRKKDRNLCRLTKIMALANSYLWYEKLQKYSDEELEIDIERRKELTDSIAIIQKTITI